MVGEAVNVFCWGDEGGEGIGLVFVLNGELEDNAVDAFVGVRAGNGGADVVGIFSKIVNNLDADVFAVFDFEINIFFDHGVLGIADDEEGGVLAGSLEVGGFTGLALLNKICEFATV